MPDPKTFDYAEVDTILQNYLSAKGYSVLQNVGGSWRPTFTYECEFEGMPFWVKIGPGLEKEKKRIKQLKNEVAALTRLWLEFPAGETNSFILPPGPEEIFEETYEEYDLYGYSRFKVEGRVLGGELREGSETFGPWVKKYLAMLSTIDALPELDLPRTQEKKDVDYSRKMIENMDVWIQQLEDSGNEKYGDIGKKLKEEAGEFLSSNKLVMGTVHGDIIPDHIVYMNGGSKPTLVNYTKLCQWSPRFFDLAMVYGWLQVVLKDFESASTLWEGFTEKNLKKNDIDYLKLLTNVTTFGVLSDYLAVEGGEKEVTFSEKIFVQS